MIFKKICLSVCILFFVSSISAEEMKNNDQNNQYNIYTGMFDFSDDGGGFLRFNPIQGALNGKEEKESST